MMLAFVHVAQGLVCGLQDETKETVIHQPRLVEYDHNTQKIGLSLLIGDPIYLVVLKPEYYYYNTDKDFETFYNSHFNKPKLSLVK